MACALRRLASLAKARLACRYCPPGLLSFRLSCYCLWVIVAMAGLPASGKSTIAEALAQLLPGQVISKDEIRRELFSEDEIDYSQAQDAVCFDEMLRLTEETIARSPGGACAILDGRTFSRADDLEEVKELADRLEEPLYVIHCVCSDEEARKRIEADIQTASHPAGNRNYGLYVEIKKRQEALPFPALHLNTELDLNACLSLCLNYLGRPLDPRLSFSR